MTKGQILKNKRGKYFFRIVTRNGNTLCHSESYSNITGAKRGINSLIKNVNNMEIEIIK